MSGDEIKLGFEYIPASSGVKHHGQHERTLAEMV